MELSEVMEFLAEHGNERTKATLVKHGARESRGQWAGGQETTGAARLASILPARFMSRAGSAGSRRRNTSRGLCKIQPEEWLRV
jgi:hypothetical protein